MTAPLVVLALPHTRARAKVHYLHIFRAAAYGFAWLVPFCLWSIGVRIVELGWCLVDIVRAPTGNFWVFSPRTLPVSVMNGGISGPVGLLIAAWLAAYWYHVLSRGWRMHKNDTVPATVSIWACSLLGGLALTFWGGELFT